MNWLKIAILIQIASSYAFENYPNCGKLRQASGFGLALGQPTNTGKHPWAVAILKKNRFGNETLVHCSGSLIHPRFVISASHCFDGRNPDNQNLNKDKLTLAFGLSNIQNLKNPNLLRAVGVKIRNITEVYQFPDYNFPLAYSDVALVELAEPVPLGPSIWPICLPTSENEDKDHLKGDSAIVAGYGQTEKSTMLNQLRHKIEQSVRCEFEYDPEKNVKKKDVIQLTLPNKFDDSLICAGDRFSSSFGTCPGDSGAPLLTDFFDPKSEEFVYKLLGVLHGGVVNCDNSEYPAIYTRISTPKIYKWIKEKILGMDSGDPKTQCSSYFAGEPIPGLDDAIKIQFKINAATEILWKDEYLTYNCVQPDLCDDNRNKSNINPRTVSLDILNGLISSAQDAKCPNESDVCCAKNFTKNPVDCVLSPWSNCSESCGQGTQQRKISIPAKNGGKECTGSLNRACNVKKCPVDCILSPWSSCSESCGQGTQQRKISISAKYGGKECNGDLNRPCNERDCPGKEGICKYNCKRNGGCDVRFQKTSGTGSGKCVGSCSGSCFSPGFGRGRCGSSCSGTPTFCSECNCKCKGKAGSQFEEEV